MNWEVAVILTWAALLQKLSWKNWPSKHSFGIVTTHYLNLKVMANKVPGIINGAMAFDEENLLPMYKLIVGKPGSSTLFLLQNELGLPKP